MFNKKIPYISIIGIIAIISLSVIANQQAKNISLLGQKIDTQNMTIQSISIAMNRSIENNAIIQQKNKGVRKNMLFGTIISIGENNMIIEAEIDIETFKKMGIKAEIGKSLPKRTLTVGVRQETKFSNKKFIELRAGDDIIIESNTSTSEKNFNATHIGYVPPSKLSQGFNK